MPISRDRVVPHGDSMLPVKKNGKKWNLSTTYSPEACEVVLRVFNEGGTKAMACAALLVSDQTVGNWRKNFPEFDEAWTAGLRLSEAWWDSKAKKNLEWINRHGEPQFRSEVYKFTKQAEFKAGIKDADVIVNVGENSDNDKVNDLIQKIRQKEI